jgi:hypothetical protein
MGVKLSSSLPGLTRQSIHLRKDFLAKEMDARVKSAFTRVFDALLPAHDWLDKSPKLTPTHTNGRRGMP